MEITTFNQLLKIENHQAEAYVPEKKGQRQLAVNVIFTPGSKVYTYKGSITSVAEKMNLIPEVDIETESQRAINELHQTGSTTTPAQCVDTINHFLNLPGKTTKETSRSQDEFDRVVVTLTIEENLWI